MAYRWKPNASQRRAFAERMADPEQRQEYEQRKEAKADKRRAGSRFNYNSAGGEYIPTLMQYQEAIRFLSNHELTTQQESACHVVMSGWSCQMKVHHDYIHIVNELSRSANY